MRRNLLWMIIISLLLTGCWDQRELSTLIIITGIAIDKGEAGKYKLTVAGLNAAELSEQTATGNSPTAVISLEGDTLGELMQKMNIVYSKKLIYSHMKLFVVSKEIASEGTFDFLDYFERSREIRDDVFCVLAKEGEARDIIMIPSIVQKDPSLKLDLQLKAAVENWGLNPDVKLNDFIAAITSAGREPIMVAVRIRNEGKKSKTAENMKQIEKISTVMIDSLALFHKKKLIGFLPKEDSRNYLWTQNKINNTSLSLNCEKDKHASVRIVESTTRLKGKIENGKPKIRLDLSMESFLNGSSCGYPMDKPDSYKKIEKMTEQYIKDSISKTIKTVQTDYGVDIFGFGEVMHRQDYKQYKKIKDHWNEAFKDAEIDIHVDVALRNAGIRTRGLFEREE